MSKKTARNIFIGGTVIFWIIFIVITLTGAGMVQSYMERLIGLDYVAVKADYNLWFWVFRSIFGLGFLHGAALLIKDVLTIGRKAPEAVAAASPAGA